MSHFQLIAETSQRIAATRERNGKIRLLAECMKQLAEDELEVGVLYLSGEIAQKTIGVGVAALYAAQVPAAIAAQLSIAQVDKALSALATIKGAGAAAERSRQLRELLALCTAAEQDFLLKLLGGELRQGALAGVMVDAIALAAQAPLAEIRRAAMYAPTLGAVARAAVHETRAALLRFELTTLSPVAPMLAESAADVADALAQLGTAAFEWKVDGARIQLHKYDDDVRVYTRNLNNVAHAIPEVVELAKTLAPRQLVLDGEVVALNATGKPLPFQVTMRRFGRKLEVDTLRHELPLHSFFFDCLRVDAVSLADRAASERIAALNDTVPKHHRIPRIVTASREEAEQFYADALAQGHEGVMAKALDAPYEAGKRGASWLKIKRAHTLDLVVLAAEWGSGRRSGFLSNLHLGARDPSGTFVMLGKTFKGMTDAMLKWQTEEFPKHEVRRDRHTVYLDPRIVVEIAFNDIQASSQYPGGYALRFARVKRYRQDKTVDQADTIDAIAKLYATQSGVEARASPKTADLVR